LFQKAVCDARIGDQRRDKASAERDTDTVCFVHAAGHGDNLGDAAKLIAGDADHALAEWWCEDFSATAQQDGAGVGADTGVEKLSTFLWSDAVIQLRLRRVPRADRNDCEVDSVVAAECFGDFGLAAE
jgi:hypothetical protein